MSKLLSFFALGFVPANMRLAAFAAIGALIGMGAYVATISNAMSYLSDDPKACINCHVMYPEYASWQHSSHARVAVCNDCHVPHSSAIAKYWFKANDGLRHSTLFTFRKERQVIQTIDASKKVIQENCVRCHSTTISEARTPIGHSFDRSCIECHREVPHGRVHSLSAVPNPMVPVQKSVVPGFLKNLGEPKQEKK